MENIQLSSDYGIMIDGAVAEGVDYIKRHPGIKTLVIGESGGVDSAVVTALCRKICDITGTKLIGYCLPIKGNHPDEVFRAVLCKQFFDEFEIWHLDGAFEDMLKDIDPILFRKWFDKGTLSHDEKVLLGNIKARCRMIFLYHRAGKNKGIVMSTDNLTELMLGFWTLHGDVGDFGLIQELWKTEVYGIADTLGGVLTEHAAATPTDGLGITNSDIDQLLPNWDFKAGNYRDAYRLVDDILIDYLDRQGNFSEDHPVIQRHLNTKFKRNNPANVKRSALLWRHTEPPTRFVAGL